MRSTSSASTSIRTAATPRLYNQYVELYDHQLQQLEQDGAALTQMSSAMCGTYQWPNDPWPWDYSQED